MEVSITAADIDDARDLFLLAKDRLLDVNDWNYASTLSGRGWQRCLFRRDYLRHMASAGYYAIHYAMSPAHMGPTNRS